jgi:hypothetical protein
VSAKRAVARGKIVVDDDEAGLAVKNDWAVSFSDFWIDDDNEEDDI